MVCCLIIKHFNFVTMKNILFIAFVIIGSSFAFSQSTVGIRIGSGNSGFESNVTNQTSNRVQVESEDVKMKSYVVLDENENVVKSKNINTSNTASVDVDNLQSGLYYIAVISEDDEVSINTYVKP